MPLPEVLPWPPPAPTAMSTSAPTAAPTGSPKTDAPGASKHTICRLCHYRFTSDGNRHYYSEQVKEQAIDRCGQGMAVAAISRVLEVKLGTVYEWVKKARWALGIWVWVTLPRQRRGIAPAISFDDMRTCQQARREKRSGGRCGSGRR